MIGNKTPACLFCKQWKRHAEILRWDQTKGGFGKHSDISDVFFSIAIYPVIVLFLIFVLWLNLMICDYIILFFLSVRMFVFCKKSSLITA